MVGFHSADWDKSIVAVFSELHASSAVSVVEHWLYKRLFQFRRRRYSTDDAADCHFGAAVGMADYPPARYFAAVDECVRTGG